MDRVMCLVRSPQPPRDADWVVQRVACLRGVSLLLVEAGEMFRAIEVGLELGVHVAGGVGFRAPVIADSRGDADGEFGVPRPSSVLLLMPQADPEDLLWCAFRVPAIAERIGASQEVVRGNLSLSSWRSMDDLPKLEMALLEQPPSVIVMPLALAVAGGLEPLRERLLQMAGELESAVVIVEALTPADMDRVIEGVQGE